MRKSGHFVLEQAVDLFDYYTSHNDISGGRVLRSGAMKVRNRANQAFRQAMHSVTRSHSSLGAYYRAMRAAWPQAGDSGDRAQDRANRVSSVEDRRAISGRKRGGV
jgi:hypothetical protein